MPGYTGCLLLLRKRYFRGKLTITFFTMFSYLYIFLLLLFTDYLYGWDYRKTVAHNVWWWLKKKFKFKRKRKNTNIFACFYEFFLLLSLRFYILFYAKPRVQLFKLLVVVRLLDSAFKNNQNYAILK